MQASEEHQPELRRQLQNGRIVTAAEQHERDWEAMWKAKHGSQA